MKHGSEWYKREPAAYLGGVQGLSAKEHAVYSVVLDLIYAHGGSVNNDPSWIAGWIKDMGAASVRKTISSLVDRDKLMIDGDKITQKRAKNEAKTKENLSETASKNGKKGGIKSAELRAERNENSNLTQAVASSENQADKIRLDKIEEDKSSSSQEVENYQKYMEVHPKPIESAAGEKAFNALIASGIDPKQIIASAASYAATVKGWSGEAKVQQSDNFLDADRGKWREHIPQPKAPKPTHAETLKFQAAAINGEKYVPPSFITPNRAAELIAAKLVTPERIRERGL